MKKFISILITFILISSSFIPSIYAYLKDGFSVIISLEGFTLGQGFYYEPEEYTLSEINSLAEKKGFGPYSADEVTASIATLAFMTDKNLQCKMTGTWDSNFYLGAIKDIDKGTLNIPDVITKNGGPSDSGSSGQKDDYLGEFDYSMRSGWMLSVNNCLINTGASNYRFSDENNKQPYGNTHVLRWQFSLWGLGDDLGIEDGSFFEGADKDRLYIAYARSENEAAKAAAKPVMENLTASENQVKSAELYFEDTPLTTLPPAEDAPVKPETEKPERPQNISAENMLKKASAGLYETVKEPSFGIFAGDWTVFALARSGYVKTDSIYFDNYVRRASDYVKANADSSGRLHSAKSTENSRLSVALSAIGRNPEKLGNVNVTAPLEDSSWVNAQGINGAAFALIAFDSAGYKKDNTDLRQKYIDFILSERLSDGGWAYAADSADPDITGMVLTALAPYKNNSAVKNAGNIAINLLSSMQNADGSFTSDKAPSAESCAQVITGLTAWGINPDTDKRFIKDGNSVIDALMSFYSEKENAFEHIKGTGKDAMATDQGVYALSAYVRFINGQTSLYDMSDVKPVSEKELPLKISLTSPGSVKNQADSSFNVIINISRLPEDNFRLIDFTAEIPSSLEVISVSASDRLSGGSVQYSVEGNKLRAVYFDASGKILSYSGDIFPGDLFTVSLKLKEKTSESELKIAVTGLSFKNSSDGSDMKTADITHALKKIKLTENTAVTVMTLYTGDGADLIDAGKKAVALCISGTDNKNSLLYGNYKFYYSPEISEKTGMTSFAGIVSTDADIEAMTDINNLTVSDSCESFYFGDVNSDGIINAQDTLDAVNSWLRKKPAADNKDILELNVNGDGRINTLDALAIADAFVDGAGFAVLNGIGELNR